jgi:hypothetical protein
LANDAVPLKGCPVDRRWEDLQPNSCVPAEKTNHVPAAAKRLDKASFLCLGACSDLGHGRFALGGVSIDPGDEKQIPSAALDYRHPREKAIAEGIPDCTNPKFVSALLLFEESYEFAHRPLLLLRVIEPRQ